AEAHEAVDTIESRAEAPQHEIVPSVEHAESEPIAVAAAASQPAVPERVAQEAKHAQSQGAIASLALPADSDLVLVETRFAAPVEAEEPEAARPRRVRPPRMSVPDEPLQMVETRKQ